MTILEEIAAHARFRAAEDEKRVPLEKLREECLALGPARGETFKEALRRPGLSFICEVKKASPSKGIIAEDFPYLQIAASYEAAHADAISCLTEPKWFLGSDTIFREIRAKVKTPMLRKDFTVGAYQIYQARAMGADAVLLICSLLEETALGEYLAVAKSLGLAALVETHDEEEIRMAVRCGAEIIGVNNRNLKDFSVDFSNSEKLRELIPPSCLFVAESGVRGPADAGRLRKIGADAVLVGEALMRSGDKAGMLRAMRNAQ